MGQKDKGKISNLIIQGIKPKCTIVHGLEANFKLFAELSGNTKDFLQEFQIFWNEIKARYISLNLTT